MHNNVIHVAATYLELSNHVTKKTTDWKRIPELDRNRSLKLNTRFKIFNVTSFVMHHSCSSVAIDSHY